MSSLSPIFLALFIMASYLPSSNAQDWMETSCDSIEVYRLSYNVDCLDFCGNQASTSFSGMEERTTGVFTQVLKCTCADNTGCLDELVILDPSRPVPKCDDLSISAIDQCNPICFQLGLSLGVFRDVNGKTICSCTGADICADDPTCAQLRIYPGTAESDCTNYCDPGVTITATDEVEFAGGAFVANKDQTHLKVGCKCGAFEECRDSILFSDLARLGSCQDDLNILVEEDCQNYCAGFGFPDSEFFITADAEDTTGDAMLRNCTCSSSEGSAVACRDEPMEADGDGDGNNDSSDGDGTMNNNGNGDNNGNTGSSSSPSFFAIGTTTVAAISITAILLSNIIDALI